MSEENNKKSASDNSKPVEKQLSAEERAKLVDQLYALNGRGGVMAGNPRGRGTIGFETVLRPTFAKPPKKK